MLVRHPVLGTAIGLLTAGLLVALVLVALLAGERSHLLALRRAHLAQRLVDAQPGLALHESTEAALAERHPEINDVLYRALDACWEEHSVLLPPGTRAADSQWIETTDDDRWLIRSLDNGQIAIVDLADGRAIRTFHHAEDATATGWTVAALGPRGTFLSGGADGVVRSFDLETGKRGRSWALHEPSRAGNRSICQIAVAHDRRHAATCGGDGLVAIVDLERGEPVRCLGHVGGVTQVEFGPQGSMLASLGGNADRFPRGDRTVRVFDATSGRCLRMFGPFPAFPHWIAWSHDGRRIAIAREENCVDVLDATQGTLVTTIANPTPVQWCGFAATDTQLVLGSVSGLAVHDVATGARVRLHGDFAERSVFRGAFTDDGRWLAVIAWDDTARIYDTRSWQLHRTFHGVTGRARGLCWNHAGSRLYTIGGTLQSWYARERPFLPVLRGHRGRIASVEFSPDGQRVLSADALGEVRIWDANRGQTQSTLQTGAPLRAARYSPSGEHLLLLGETTPPQWATAESILRPLGDVAATDAWFLGEARIVLAGSDGAVRVVDATTGAVQQSIACHDGPILCGRLHARLPQLATGGSDRTFCLVDLEGGRVLHRHGPWLPGRIGEQERVFDLAFSSDGRELYAACEDLYVRAVDLAADFRTREFKIGPTPGWFLVDPDGGLVTLSARWGGRLYRWDTRRCEALESMAAPHANMLVALEMQSQGTLALSASKDGTVAVFDSRRDQLISLIPASRAPLVAAHFSRDGAHIVTADADGFIRIWPTDPLPVALRVRPDRPPLARDR